MFYMKSLKTNNFALKTNFFLQKKTSKLGTTGFSGIFDFAVVWLHFSRERIRSGSIFLHFLQKYRCVPKIGFSADISIDILADKEEGGGRKEWTSS